MRRLLGVILSLGLASSGGFAAETRPNVVVIVSDDHRADVLGAAGHPIATTPNLDRLAADGIRFENGFVTTSICAASRASILTGLPESAHHFTFGRPPLDRDLALASYPARLRDAGYRTGFVGKFGISVASGRPTIDAMFDEFMPLTRTPYRKTLPDGTTRHVTDLIGDAAVTFILSTPADQSFCLSISFNAGHAEDGDLADHYPPPDAEASLLDGVPMPRPRLDGGETFDELPPFVRDSMNRDRWHWRWDTPEKYDRNLRNYFRLLAGLDRNVGRMLEALEASGHADDTVIVFLGDNGYYMGERGLAGKWSHFEESLRIPLIVFDPRAPESRRGVVEDDLVLNIDVAPTVLGLAGLDAPDAAGAGRPLPLAGTPNGRTGFHCGHGMKHPRIPRWVGYRDANAMYARYLDVEDGGECLYDLATDPDERRNVAGAPEATALLKRMRLKTDEAFRDARAAGPPLPRVLLLGDSISMGYHDAVVRALDDEATVIRPKGNCEGTTKGVAKIADWLALDGGDFDVEHFNFGLHDLKRVGADGRSSNDPADANQASLEQYEQQLRAITEAIVKCGATPIFATTTPVPEGGVRPHRDPADVDRYNAVAREIMGDFGIAIDEPCATRVEVVPFTWWRGDVLAA
jgi:arylsulfatase A-like enzyme